MIKFAESDMELQGCYPVIAQLRPHLTEAGFFSRVRGQGAASGFRLPYISVDGVVKAVAGIRAGEWLAGGKYLEIEDLVTAESARSKGYGGELFDWIVDLARNEGCDELRLVSNVTRYGAHRFYLNKRMRIQAYYFSMGLSSEQ